MTDKLESLNPITGDVVGTHPVDTAVEVQEAVDRAFEAAAWWAGLSFAQRGEHLDRWKGVITRRMGQLVNIVCEETGKPYGDAQLEVGLAIDHLGWASKNAGKVLGRKKVSSGLLMANQAAYVQYQPLGVVGVIGPWNYPVFTPMGSIAYAIAAGNPVVFKPSEYTPGVGRWLADTCAEAIPEHPLLQVVTGYGETGAALCRSGVNKVAFTGSTETGKKVMAACAENLVPVVIEAGGKDVLIVDSDADIAAAADAAVWGAMSNAGQTCTGVERVYVHERVHDEFVAEVLNLVKDVHAEPDGKIGPITMPAQVDVIRRHIADAIARGGRALVGGVDSVGERFVQPTVLVDVPEDSLAVTDETFGPTMTISKVSDMDDAVLKANASRYGLGATIFSKSRGLELASRIRSGMAAVNGVISFAGIPSLPFGGVGASGFGRIHGADGLREFTYAKSVAVQRFKAPLLLTSFSRGAKEDAMAAKVFTLLHGGKGTLPPR